jgi:hypothetical protein
VPTVLIALLASLACLGVTNAIRAARPKAPRLPEGLLDLARQLESDWSPRLAALRASGVPLNAYNNLTSRADAAALLPEEVSNQMLTNLQERAQGSAVLKTFTRVPVSRGQVRLPILSALPVAYWVTGDTGLKQTSEVNWANKFLNIEELAVIVPIPENVVDDAGTPIWDQVQPLCEEAAARLIDGTVTFGTNAPASFPTNIVAAAAAAGNTVTIGTNNASKGGIVGDHADMLEPARGGRLRRHGRLRRAQRPRPRPPGAQQPGRPPRRGHGRPHRHRARRRPLRARHARPVADQLGHRGSSSRSTAPSSPSASGRTSTGSCSTRRSSRTTPARSSTTSRSRTWSRCG